MLAQLALRHTTLYGYVPHRVTRHEAEVRALVKPARVGTAEVRDHRYERSLSLAPLGRRSETLRVQYLQSTNWDVLGKRMDRDDNVWFARLNTPREFAKACEAGLHLLEPTTDWEFAIYPENPPQERILRQRLVGRHKLSEGPHRVVGPNVNDLALESVRVDLVERVADCVRRRTMAAARVRDEQQHLLLLLVKFITCQAHLAV
mmetsp:Transcript_8216/g.21127  ORF Transcript_8216/g.21127 Transcript_8216/m.21127 type:complete len:204 (+) Transcript_8216:93-704(+)